MSLAPPLRVGVHHLAVKATDLGRSERFYTETLGLRVARRHEDERGPRSIWVRLGESDTPFLAIERADAPTPLREDAAPGWHCVALTIDVQAREAWRQRLALAGHPVFHETPYTLYVRDPDGAVLALSHHPVPAMTEPSDARPSDITSRLSALVTVSIVLLALTSSLAALWPAASSAQRRGASATPPDALIIGSSSVNGALGRLIESELASAGMHPRRIAHSSTGFSRPDFFDWDEEVPRLPNLRGVRGVVVYIGGNDAQAIRLRANELPAAARGRRPTQHEEWIIWREGARWSEVYQRRVQTFVDLLCSAGARRVAVLLPAEGENGGWSSRMERIQELQAAGTRASRCGTVIDPRGVRVRDGATVDGIHLSRTGARAVWDRVGASIVQALTP